MASGLTSIGASVSAGLSALVAGIIILFFFPLPQGKVAQTVAGRAHVVDGDSLEIGSLRLRLYGLDAPELRQQCSGRDGRSIACGQEARKHLLALIEGREVVCTGLERDRYERLLVTCRAGDRDLNDQMVADGWAVSYGAYQSVEGRARRERRGLWDGDFEEPASWRRRHAQ